jgi:transcriptional regulator with XRE-family HTH domain
MTEGVNLSSTFTKDLIRYKSDLPELALLKYEAQGLVERVGVEILLSRTKQNLTQKELAKRARVDQGDISRIENGEVSATIFTLGKIFSVLKLDFETLTADQRRKLEAPPILKVKKAKKVNPSIKTQTRSVHALTNNSQAPRAVAKKAASSAKRKRVAR